MKELKQIFEYDRYSSEELKRHRDELQAEINVINGELNLRRADLIESLKNQLYDIFEKAKEQDIAIEIHTKNEWWLYKPGEDGDILGIEMN